jgi:hypothetical protein
MHSYQRRWPDDLSTAALPDISEPRFRDALDVARFAELDWLLAWRTWPEVWHLDDDGAFCCASRGSSLDSVRTFAKDPLAMLDCRLVPTGGPCPNRWLVIESRHPYHQLYHPDEGDAAAFVTLRQELADFGITLLDVMVFHQEFHWWSLHELTSGTTAWTPPAPTPMPVSRSGTRRRSATERT